ncbi:DNA repair protein REV1 isoform X1 [Vigna radiata var. radiata]|uniref:DNA repair protein REV1 n=1 Tax=Vigna radiata var. radiata TaxID=3916 RepID=A0A1S3VR32_VIGRR|nr:DNA repair protein REV1 isoform X1 [Vigna radiata var. radiata]XP_014520838.1 DNA repair protein REV1 isoform X1 [Vigna radiata var. radiata]XP_022631674.1 DNA repair protein REV1 isoform X1 [Vigna radiata var. radiata]XP_022631675.1 DNA repair protein REV1 isoform X1 [Vigna radiata var. radiata]XP_022631676.1 DNA repair protein REV1 isoform X1 [Vigna radiata var. radiata]XP_022631677.1 DNA repair protein REV1 isoform X1 [Vigna radiata var. radiata]XP_022631678.1 DNA repair protein REV1 is
MSLDSSRSANSKRSFSNSISSNRSNDSSKKNSKRKKTITNQKTLGAVWGSNSSSRASSRNSAFSGFASYMTEKNRKLHNQFDAEASASSLSDSTVAKPIFSGVSIFVDGFTVPSSQELRSYMLKNGGRFENYFSRHRVTHIICSNLPDSKVKNLRAFSAGLPVVKPTWILDSVAANRLLSWVPYQLDQLANKQSKLSAFFTMKSSKMSEDALTNSLCQVVSDVEDSSMRVGQTDSDDRNLSKVGEMSEHIGQISTTSGDIENSNAIITEEPTSVRVKFDEEQAARSNAAAKDESNVKSELGPTHQAPSTSFSSHCSDEQNAREFPSSSGTKPFKQCHSTFADPNFVENYFKSSRLHFIGTWRNRYRKRFSALSSGFKNENSNISASNTSSNSVIIHVDMDCFFVSVVIRNHPELLDQPVAVSHSNNSNGTAEISSANYPARSHGIRAGMFVRDAKALCPQLVIFPYNFEAYEEVADQFYSILHQHCNKVQAVSCDEAFLDVTDLEVEDPKLLASSIREEIYKTTGCTASAGIAGNMLMARIATRTAKPNGQYYITTEKVEDHLCQLPINSLPGIGHVLQEKLKKQNIYTCGQLRIISKASLQRDYGIKTGEMLWNYSRGIDNRLVGNFQESKTVGADVNWGVRFKDIKDCEHFLISLCKEVSLRLQCCGVQGRTFTLKIKKRRKGAGEPAKFMGCGDCENLSHSITVPLATDNVEILQRIVKQLFGCFNIDVKEIRGIGLQVSRLESAEASKRGTTKYTLKSWLTSASAGVGNQTYPIGNDKHSRDNTSSLACVNLLESSVEMDNKIPANEASTDPISTPPPLCNLDIEVIRNLPPDVFSELNEIYRGKLVDYIANWKNTSESSSLSGNSFCEQKAINNEEEPSYSEPIPQGNLLSKNKAKQYVSSNSEGETIPYSVRGPNFKFTHHSSFENNDLFPSSLSQVDGSVFQQLPEDFKADIVEQLPAHRRPDICSNVVIPPLENHSLSVGVEVSDNSPICSYNNDSLWVGNPPNWVEKFKGGSCLILKKLAEMYLRSGLANTLSSVLHQIISEFYELNLAQQFSDETVDIMCELLRQYIKVKIERDIEEIYICFRLLKRFAAKSQFFLQVYDTVYPYLQWQLERVDLVILENRLIKSIQKLLV